MFGLGLWKKWLRHPVIMYKFVRCIRRRQKLEKQIDTTNQQIAFIRSDLRKATEILARYGKELEQ